MLIPKTPTVRDRKYLDSFGDEACWCCGAQDGTVVGAHIRAGELAGMGRKPSDDLVIPLCHRCHMHQEEHPGAEWWLENILKPITRRKYEMWRKDNE